MKKILSISLVIIGGATLIALILAAGFAFVRAGGLTPYANTPSMMNWMFGGSHPGYAMRGNRFTAGQESKSGTANGWSGMTPAPAPRAGVEGNQGGMMGGNRGGMMGGYTSSSGPLTVDQAKQAVEGYLKGLNNLDLELKEIMIFDNNAYARITEKSTGIGAMELLVDPATLAVFPEYGPNMMWNLKYGHMSGAGNRMSGNRGGMMGGFQNNPGSTSLAMTVTSDQAAKIAQQYLDQQFPGTQAATEPDAFYGYYTIDIMKDGKPTGMLSVNGFSGQVFLHTWHGTFIEMFE